jgi:heterogeneous nuclear rnp K-like protein 2
MRAGTKLTSVAIRLLISHNQMGTIIGRQGLKIKQIQDASGVRMVAQKEMLPQSTERIVEVQGSPGGIEKAIWEIGKCLIDDSERGYGTVLYNPAVRVQPGAGPVPLSNGGGAPSGGMSGRSYNRTGHGADFSDSPPAFSRRSGSDAASRPPPPTHTEDGEEMQTQNISIPSDMVGCIIGRGGSKISEIRKTSNARISSACLPSLVVPVLTRRRSIFSMRTLRLKRCVAARPRSRSLRRYASATQPRRR